MAGLSGNGARRKRLLPQMDSVRGKYEEIASLLPLPKINPDFFSAGSIVLSAVFSVLAFRGMLSLAFPILAMVFIFDALDGILARKRGGTGERGEAIDFFSDRLSEGLITLPFFSPWFLVFSLNNAIALLGLSKGRHTVLPIRFFILIWLGSRLLA